MQEDELREELNRLREEVNYWKAECARIDEHERALNKRRKKLENQLRKLKEDLEDPNDLQAFEAEIKRFDQLLEMLSQEPEPGRDSPDSAQTR